MTTVYIEGVFAHEDGKGFVIQWADIEHGLGKIRFTQDGVSNLTIDAEYMSKDFVRKILCSMVDEGIIIG